MKVIPITEFGPPFAPSITDVRTPSPSPGEALIEVAAFHINHAEMHTRRGEWA